MTRWAGTAKRIRFTSGRWRFGERLWARSIPPDATARNNLAGLYADMGRHAEAQDLSERLKKFRGLSLAGPEQ
jgi:hypothetical protein